MLRTSARSKTINYMKILETRFKQRLNDDFLPPALHNQLPLCPASAMPKAKATDNKKTKNVRRMNADSYEDYRSFQKVTEESGRHERI
ncbi:MAG: hypothetical protein ACR5K7_04715, partial [Symbiopectobacterium sp.]